MVYWANRSGMGHWSFHSDPLSSRWALWRWKGSIQIGHGVGYLGPEWPLLYQCHRARQMIRSLGEIYLIIIVASSLVRTSIVGIPGSEGIVGIPDSADRRPAN